jgi:transcriptional antiterminator RfaH
MPHAVGLVAFGGEPARVPDELVGSIRARLAARASAASHSFDHLQRGDEVFIHAGPFSGYEAVFDTSLSDGERVRVLLQILGSRAVSVELSRAHIERARAH